MIGRRIATSAGRGIAPGPSACNHGSYTCCGIWISILEQFPRVTWPSNGPRENNIWMIAMQDSQTFAGRFIRP